MSQIFYLCPSCSKGRVTIEGWECSQCRKINELVVPIAKVYKSSWLWILFKVMFSLVVLGVLFYFLYLRGVFRV